MNIETQDQSRVLEKNEPANGTNNTEIKSNSAHIGTIKQKSSTALINSNDSIVDNTYNNSTLKIIMSPGKTSDNYQFSYSDNEKSAILNGNIKILDNSINESNQDQSSIKLNERIEDKRINNDIKIITNNGVNETNNLKITTTTTDDIGTTTPDTDQIDDQNAGIIIYS